MKAFLRKIGLSLLKYLLLSDFVHDALRKAVTRTSNTYDDKAVNALIDFMIDVHKELEAK